LHLCFIMNDLALSQEELNDLTKSFSNFKVPEDASDDDISKMTDCLRCIRNQAAGNVSNQTLLGSSLLENDILPGFILRMVKNQLEPRFKASPCKNVAVNVSLQVINNMIVGHFENQVLLVKSETIMEALNLIFQDQNKLETKSRLYGSHVVCCLLRNHGSIKDECQNFCLTMSKFLPTLFHQYQRGGEWSSSCLELYLNSESYLQHLTSEQRVAMVDILPFPPCSNVLQLLVSDFTYLTDVHLLTTGQESTVSGALEANHILSLTRFLATCSSQDQSKLPQMMKNNKSLVINTFYLLKLIHQSAGVDQNLTVLSKLSDVMDLDETDPSNKIVDSPTFGFKWKLIELLTNLVWEHPDNQTLVGELDGVALLLDCSQIDARNPLITQRVILAIRALTYDHAGNQSVLAGMEKLGAADGDLLSELGLYRDNEGKIRKLDR